MMVQSLVTEAGNINGINSVITALNKELGYLEGDYVGLGLQALDDFGWITFGKSPEILGKIADKLKFNSIIKKAENISTAKNGQSAKPRDLNEQLFWNEIQANPAIKEGNGIVK